MGSGLGPASVRRPWGLGMWLLILSLLKSRHGFKGPHVSLQGGALRELARCPREACQSSASLT